MLTHVVFVISLVCSFCLLLKVLFEVLSFSELFGQFSVTSGRVRARSDQISIEYIINRNYSDGFLLAGQEEV